MTKLTETITETIIEDARWRDPDLAALAERAARATLGALDLDPEGVEIAVLGCDDARIAALNADFRGRPRSTNVLSWPSEPRGEVTEGAPPPQPRLPELGDIAIAWDTCAREAETGGIALTDHATHLLVHAILHLLGYDHVRDGDATLMERIETEILGKLSISNPYRMSDG